MGIYLKRHYNHDASKSEWWEREDGKKVPPVSGVEIKRFIKNQKFSTRFVHGGMGEGWLSLADGNITIQGIKKTLVYKINELPGKQPDGRTTHSYSCELVEES